MISDLSNEAKQAYENMIGIIWAEAQNQLAMSGSLPITSITANTDTTLTLSNNYSTSTSTSTSGVWFAGSMQPIFTPGFDADNYQPSEIPDEEPEPELPDFKDLPDDAKNWKPKRIINIQLDD